MSFVLLLIVSDHSISVAAASDRHICKCKGCSSLLIRRGLKFWICHWFKLWNSNWSWYFLNLWSVYWSELEKTFEVSNLWRACVSFVLLNMFCFNLWCLRITKYELSLSILVLLPPWNDSLNTTHPLTSNMKYFFSNRFFPSQFLNQFIFFKF